MYNVTDGDKATKGNELGIFEDLGDVYSQDDLDLFFSTVAQYAPQAPFSSTHSNPLPTRSPQAHTQSSMPSTAPKPQQTPQTPAQNPTWTSKSPTP